jgi:hypothetical protein
MTGDEWMKTSKVLAVSSVTWPFVQPALEKVGMTPDINAIQEQAREYVVRQAGNTLLGASGDILPGLAGAMPSGDIIPGFVDAILSGDITEASNDVTP